MNSSAARRRLCCFCQSTNSQGSPKDFVARVLTSMKTSVSPSNPIRSSSPLLPRNRRASMSYPCFSKKRQAILSPRRPSNKCSATMIIMFPEPGLYFKQSRDCFEVFVVQEEQLLPPRGKDAKNRKVLVAAGLRPGKTPRGSSLASSWWISDGAEAVVKNGESAVHLFSGYDQRGAEADAVLPASEQQQAALVG